ncbi:hypothetical protein [Streptococcus sciuri]|uniref:Phage protein n=1 Tax=Streptococcus sciuri TaxID=2973939 RepID=A0ABT2F7B8_9STRE|nr:hypothetical protein [Streptococcus sciuri]MCS4488363.1 hypothetical protein [Streptococcus sciuri]
MTDELKPKRKGYKDIKDQMEANKRWAQKNREHKLYLNGRSQARGFIRNRATKDDLEELLALIEENLKKFD